MWHTRHYSLSKIPTSPSWIFSLISRSNGLLGATSLVKGRDVQGGDRLIGDDHLELIVLGVGDEEVKLNRPVWTDSGLGAQDENAPSEVPREP